jgi:hypothetical protein
VQVGSITIDTPVITAKQIKDALSSSGPKRFLIVSEEKLTGGERGKVYSGQWRLKNNVLVKDGFGVLKWPDGSSYVGQFADDYMSGSGRMIQCTGDVYEGQWRNNQANGQGKFVDTAGSTYKGEWLDDLQHGFGSETWQEATVKFTGNYVRGRKEGRGRYDWPDGSYYEGEFIDSKFDGEGTYYFAQSDKWYQGTFA